MSVLFILGAGASVDSGYATYRGPGGHYAEPQRADCNSSDPLVNPLHVTALDDPDMRQRLWETLKEILYDTPGAVPQLGPTYGKIAEPCSRALSSGALAMVVTQNVDGLVRRLPTDPLPEIVELHGDGRTCTCSQCVHQEPLPETPPAGLPLCPHCDSWMRPDVLLFGEDVPKDRLRAAFTFVKRARPATVYVVGTTMRFPYLHEMVRKARQKGARIVHVNPDPEYDAHTHRFRIKMGPAGARRVRVRLKRSQELIGPKMFIDL